ncbi:uncharacterized protein LOC111702208 [Eurytemora carolleeae]|uniref:uncharacterized protein LOC111702208 n=1 Tax=Eurytemora carolleeae TaxID=1294199 RepID=UPI000C76CB4B|nr:uncharacterized protein LOC111702208 [Eurytemora carolleeae]|eukprot:XP_023329590.1 uncharacterized protein LOC111702208 [Eurytemora affinis]
MVEYTACTKELVGDLSTWSNISRWEVYGAVDELSVDLDEICSSEYMDTHIMIFPAWLVYSEAEEMCHRFGGWVNFDADPDLLKGRDMIMFEKVKQFSYGNQPNDRCGKRLLIGINDLEEEGVWRITRTNQLLENFLYS